MSMPFDDSVSGQDRLIAGVQGLSVQRTVKWFNYRFVISVFGYMRKTAWKINGLKVSDE